MGEIAEDILDGSCCQDCGQYFEHPKKAGIYVHEYPVTCWDCWKNYTEKEKKNKIKSDVKTF